MTRILGALCGVLVLCTAILAVGCSGSQPPSSAAARSAAQNPKPCRGTLGIEAVPASREIRKKLALPKDFHGAVVLEVLPGGPAAAAGIRPNDVVEKVGPASIANDCDFADAAFSRACEPVRVLVQRGGRTIEVTLVPVDQVAFYDASCRSGAPSACFRQAWAGWTRGNADSRRAAELFDSACKAGSADACAYEGLELSRGDRGAEALRVLERSCKMGSAGGCANLAFLYATAKFVNKDDRRARGLYVKSCDRGDAQGCYNVGLMAQDGRGGPAEISRAVAAYEEACELGSSTGCTNLGFLSEHGHGVRMDKARAVELYRRGCNGTSCQPSNLNGCVNLGRAYRDGIGVEKSEPRAASIFREACDRKANPDDVHSQENGARACSLLGGLYLAGDGVPMDLVQGRQLSQLGCERHDSFGCFNAAAVFAAGSGVEKDAGKAASYLEQACQEGDAEGCHDLGIAYQKGDGVAADQRRAAELFQRACRLGFAQSCAKKAR